MTNLLSVVIPAYNEEVSLETYLPEVIDHCKRNNYTLIVVNDGSKDKTAEILKKYEGEATLKVVTHKVNRGYGGAIKSGIKSATTDFVITIDADGQHYLEDIDKLLDATIKEDADMLIGSRKGNKGQDWYRSLGKHLIRSIARAMVKMNIYDLNSGMKLYNTKLAQKYLKLCPDSMAYSDVIALLFINLGHKVEERPIRIKERIGGVSTISTMTAVETIKEILNVVVLMNPMRLFAPLGMFFILVAIAWDIPIFIKSLEDPTIDGVSVGALLLFMTGLILFMFGFIAEQLALIRKNQI